MDLRILEQFTVNKQLSFKLFATQEQHAKQKHWCVPVVRSLNLH